MSTDLISNESIIETYHLSKRHGMQMRVKDLHMQVPPECVYGFLGPNGAGKTTTLKLLLGLIKPTEGKVTIFGQEMTEKNRLKLLKRTGSLIESPSFYGHLTGAENLEIIAKLKGIKSDEVINVMHIVRLYEQKDKKLKHYSLGMKQRLGIASAILGNPEVLILDEPTNGLDPAGIQEMRKFIKSLPSTYHMTVIVSSHLLNEIQQMADQVGIINHGEMVFQGTMKELETHGDNLEDIFLTLTGGTESL